MYWLIKLIGYLTTGVLGALTSLPVFFYICSAVHYYGAQPTIWPPGRNPAVGFKGFIGRVFHSKKAGRFGG